MLQINNDSQNDISTVSSLVEDLYEYTKNTLGFQEDISGVNFLSDEANAANPLGMTAYYDPGSKAISIFVDGRHDKDILRSFAHEVVHHAQNCRGDFDSTTELGEGYAQNDEHLREMEREAYEQGNLLMRDWEDGKKKVAQEAHLVGNAGNPNSYGGGVNDPDMASGDQSLVGEGEVVEEGDGVNLPMRMGQNLGKFVSGEGNEKIETAIAHTGNEKAMHKWHQTRDHVRKAAQGLQMVGHFIKGSHMNENKIEEIVNDVVQEMMNEGGTMGEYGKQDASEGLPPSKTGSGNKEYMAAYDKEKNSKKETTNESRKRKRSQDLHNALMKKWGFSNED